MLLKQTLGSHDSDVALNTRGPLLNAGSYTDLVYRHKPSEQVTMEFRFSTRPRRPERDKELGSIPPVEIRMDFDAGDYPGDINLSGYRLFDRMGRHVLTRRRLKSGRYSNSGFPRFAKGMFGAADDPLLDLKALDDDWPALRSRVRDVRPQHFRFTGREALETLIADIGRRESASQDEDGQEVALEISALTVLYSGTLQNAAARLDSVLENLSYVGPLREPFRRIYEVSGEMPANVGIRGETAPEILFQSQDVSLLKDTNTWLSKFGARSTLEWEAATDDAFRLVLTEKGSPATNIADVGFGFSQILPLIIQGLTLPDDGVIVAEQPEIHLNPRLQGVLGDLFVSIVNQDKGIFVETHSEHLLLRVRRLIAEGELSASDVSLLYVEQDDGKATIRSIEVTDNGHIEPADWPKGFFEDSLREALGLSSAQSK